METLTETVFAQEVKHININGKQFQLFYEEYRTWEGYSIVRYYTKVDGKTYHLELNISKEILQAIQAGYDNDIYHIIVDSIVDQIKAVENPVFEKIHSWKADAKSDEIRNNDKKAVWELV